MPASGGWVGMAPELTACGIIMAARDLLALGDEGGLAGDGEEGDPGAP